MDKMLLKESEPEIYYLHGKLKEKSLEKVKEQLCVAETSGSQEYSTVLKYQLFICKYLQSHFGSKSASVQQEVMRTNDEITLSELIYRLFQIRSLDEASAILTSR